MGKTRVRGVVTPLELINKLKTAQEAKGRSQDDVAYKAGISVKTLQRLYAGEYVDKSNLISVCKELEIPDNEVVIALSPRSEEEDRNGQLDNPTDMNNSSVTQQNLTPSTSVVQGLTITIPGITLKRFLENEKLRSAIAVIEAEAQQISGDVTLRIGKIEDGSIKITFNGSPQGLKRLADLFESGDFTEVLGLPIEDVQLITRDIESESNTNSEDKVHIIQEIVTQRAERRNLSGVDLSNTNLECANLHDADLSGTNLSGTNLSGTNLSGTNLSDVNLENAILTNANLDGADLRGANLRGANLDGANLRSANLENAKIDDTTKLDDEWRLVWRIKNRARRNFRRSFSRSQP